MIEHCISAFSKSQEKKAYQTYVTDALKVISENSAGVEQRTAMAKRWIDLIDVNTTQEPEEARSADEIIADFKNRLNRKEVN